MDIKTLEGKRLEDLKKIAADLGIKYAYRLRKTQLIEAITAAQGQKIDETQPEKNIESVQIVLDKAVQSGAEEKLVVEDVQERLVVSEEREEREERSENSEGAEGEKPQVKLRRERGNRRRGATRMESSEPVITLDQLELPSRDKDEETALKKEAVKESLRRELAGETAGESEEEKGTIRSLDQIELPSAGDETRARRRRGRGRLAEKEGRAEQKNVEVEATKTARNEQEVEREEPMLPSEDLQPIAGVLEIQNNHAFVRTSGYSAGVNDVYVTLGQVRRWGLRSGDAIQGAVKLPKDDAARRQKYNALYRLDAVNGMTPEQAKERPEFKDLVPLYPNEMLRLEMPEGRNLTQRMIDLIAPIGKGQRGLIVSPPKAGKTIILQQIANAIVANNPECHLMVVLVDERPEEVTDMQRTVKGEVIASTFDRPASDHTSVAELAIERAKRLVEMGRDVVLLLDSITRLGRAYNLSAPASGRVLSGGVDASALYPPKKFFGAARNVENGGSLTILATALVETNSKMDEVIFEEFKGTGNMELRLSRALADKRMFPAVDVQSSGTRREELLLNKEVLAITWKLRRILGALEPMQASEFVLNKLKETGSNAEFLMAIAKMGTENSR